MEAFERLSGKRKDFTSLHVEAGFSLQKKENGRYIKLPDRWKVSEVMEGFAWKRQFPDIRQRRCVSKKKVSAISEKCLLKFRSWNSGKSFRNF